MTTRPGSDRNASVRSQGPAHSDQWTEPARRRSDAAQNADPVDPAAWSYEWLAVDEDSRSRNLPADSAGCSASGRESVGTASGFDIQRYPSPDQPGCLPDQTVVESTRPRNCLRCRPARSFEALLPKCATLRPLVAGRLPRTLTNEPRPALALRLQEEPQLLEPMIPGSISPTGSSSAASASTDATSNRCTESDAAVAVPALTRASRALVASLTAPQSYAWRVPHYCQA